MPALLRLHEPGQGIMGPVFVVSQLGVVVEKAVQRPQGRAQGIDYMVNFAQDVVSRVAFLSIMARLGHENETVFHVLGWMKKRKVRVELS